jgi:hypothetical protein
MGPVSAQRHFAPQRARDDREFYCPLHVIPDAVQHEVLHRCSGTHTCCHPEHQPNPAWVPCLRSGTTRRSAHGMTESFIAPHDVIPDAVQHEVLHRCSGTHTCCHPEHQPNPAWVPCLCSGTSRRSAHGMTESFIAPSMSSRMRCSTQCCSAVPGRHCQTTPKLEYRHKSNTTEEEPP